MLLEQIVSIIASGAIAAILSSVATLAKVRAENQKYIAEANAARTESEKVYIESLSQRLKDIQESHTQEMEKLRRQNKDLEDKVTTLNGKLEQLLDWIYGSDLQYKSSLEQKVTTLDPTFPINRPQPPDIMLLNHNSNQTP